MNKKGKKEKERTKNRKRKEVKKHREMILCLNAIVLRDMQPLSNSPILSQITFLACLERKKKERTKEREKGRKRKKKERKITSHRYLTPVSRTIDRQTHGQMDRPTGGHTLLESC